MGATFLKPSNWLLVYLCIMIGGKNDFYLKIKFSTN